MTTQDAFYGKKNTTNNAESLDALMGVFGAGWMKFATRLVCKSTERAVVEGESVLVETDK